MKELLKLARNAIESKFENKEIKVDEEIKKKYSEKKASFVTLTKHGQLRGCIGSLYPKQELYKDVIENAGYAAFDDCRFFPVRKEELKDIKIEVSILSTPEKISFKGEKELLDKIDKNMGIILKKGYNSATFLPQVWEEIPDKVEFLEELSIKAGMTKEKWKNSEVYFYRVEKIKEK